MTNAEIAEVVKLRFEQMQIEYWGEVLFPIPDFENYPASTNFHHAYDYGLSFHTYEVLSQSMEVCTGNNNNRKIVYNAALWHDYGKKWEYKKEDDKWVKCDTYTPQGHMFKSIEEWKAVAQNLTAEEIEGVIHAIEAHHGRKEWNAICEPKTAEALLIHHADDFSAKFGMTKDGPPVF